jgi:uncharacterized protein
MTDTPACTAFVGSRRLARGPILAVALAAKTAAASGARVLVFDDSSGRVVDLDLSGSEVEVRARYAAAQAEARGRGRPKLGVVAREVTLLPRQWDWLAAQPGGASAALRRFVDAARKQGEAAERQRLARERAYRFLHAQGGDLPGFEDAARALFAGDEAGFEARLAGWPREVAAYARELAAGGFAAEAAKAEL